MVRVDTGLHRVFTESVLVYTRSIQVFTGSILAINFWQKLRVGPPHISQQKPKHRDDLTWSRVPHFLVSSKTMMYDDDDA